MSWRSECSSVHEWPSASARWVGAPFVRAVMRRALVVMLVLSGHMMFGQGSGHAQTAKPPTQKPAATKDAQAKPSTPNPAATSPATTGSSAGASAAPSAATNTAGIAGARPATTPKPPAAEPVPAGPIDAAAYVVRLRDLESRIDELKEQIRRSHTRLSLLSDTILSGGVGGAEANIVFRNEMSNAFRVVSVLFVLDGAVMKKEQDDTGELAARRIIPVYEGTLTPGDHTLQVVVVFQGHGYGVFSYLRAHKYTTKHTHSFTVREGKLAKIEATAYEKGGVTTPIDQRPNVRFTEKIVGSLDDAPAGAE